MSRRRIPLRKVKEVLRLHYECGLSQARIATICNIGRGSVQNYIHRMQETGSSWESLRELTETDVESALYTQEPATSGKKPLDYAYWIQELRKPNVTKALLWEEYKQAYPDGYQYSRFCFLLRRYQNKQQYSMRQRHKAGEKLFVDFGSIEGIRIIDSRTGAPVGCSLFVASWGASTYLFAKATASENVCSWIQVHNDALEYFGCVPQLIVPDNLKAAVIKGCRYEPYLNQTYVDFARHYGTALLPARPAKPKDKAKVENSVLLAKKWILARLRNRVFYSIAELNEAIDELLHIFNAKIMKNIAKSRLQLFEELDKKHARALPRHSYVYTEYKDVRVNINYHIEFAKHHYSVPYKYIHEKVQVCARTQSIDIRHKDVCICSHARSYVPHEYTTITDHMPPAHKKYIEWTPKRIEDWAVRQGLHVQQMVQQVMQSRAHPEQGFKACLGILRLGQRYGADRLDAACARALNYRAYYYRSIKTILEKGLDKQIASGIPNKAPSPHDNIRGQGYYVQLEHN